MKDSIQNWLHCETSLTERLQMMSGEAKLEVLQHFSDTTPREILMWSNGDPCWYARTYIPEDTFAANPTFFLRLQNEPLSALIYHNQMIKRIDLHCRAIGLNDTEFTWLKPEWILPETNILWMRSSEFCCESKHHFYLYEIFLPSLLRYCHEESFELLAPNPR